MSTMTITKKISGKTKNIELNRYAGKWVAFVNGRIVAAADYLPALEKEVKEKKLEKRAVYFLVPRKDEGPYIRKIVIKMNK